MTEISPAVARFAPRVRAPAWEIAAVLALLLAELALVGWTYQIARPFDCALTGAPRLCALGRGLGVKLAAILILLALYLPTRPEALRRLRRPRVEPWGRRACLPAHVAGVAMVLWPAFALDPARDLTLMILAWTLGGVLALASAALWVAPARVWAAFARRGSWRLGAIVFAGFLLPGLVEALDVLWRIDGLSRLTFGGVALLVGLVSSNVTVDGARYIIGSDGFVVMVADGCSGVQGVALISALLGAYLIFHRRDLRFPAAFLLIPIGIGLSLLFNIVRIAALIEIGARGAPDLAVNGFHSNAGWLIFTLLSLGLIAVARSSRVFRAEHPRAPMPLPPRLCDPYAARILPFVVLMASGMVTATFATVPGLWYPLRAMAIGAALLAFLPAYRAIDWRPDAASVLAGLGVGALWLATRGPAGPADLALTDRLGEVSPENLLLWIVFRVLGTALLVPIAEELFFRDYLLRPGARRGALARGAALILSAACFAILHDRWIAAFTSGLVFGLLAFRANRVGPAVAAHVVANTTIAAWALASGDWSVI